ncbi:MAG: protein kinase [archaeon]|nr:protein kinase [archaeon]
MGICTSSSSNHRQRSNKPKCENKSEDQSENLKNKRKYSINTKTTYTTKRNEFILPESLAKHENISKYYILSKDELGNGGSGVVCEAEDFKGNKYAVKRINKSSIRSKDALIKEAEFNRKFKHPNIIQCHDIFEDDSTISFVLELAEGGDLFDLIINSPKSKLPVFISVFLFEQILDTINFLHNEQNVLHRDIKPENMMVQITNDDLPLVKLIDFGLSEYKPIKGDKSTFLTDFVGTPEYAAPELMSYQPYDEKVDMWALGVLLYNMITGFVPFSSKFSSQLKEQIIFKKINFDNIEDENLRELCKRLLERDPEKRIEAKEALLEIREIKKKWKLILKFIKKKKMKMKTKQKKLI